MQASRGRRSHASYACTYDKEKHKPSQLKPIQSKQVRRRLVEFLVFNRASLASQLSKANQNKQAKQTKKTSKQVSERASKWVSKQPTNRATNQLTNQPINQASN